jgi:hypothetical protein
MLADARSAVALPRKADFVPYGGGSLWDGRVEVELDAVPFLNRSKKDTGDSKFPKLNARG